MTAPGPAVAELERQWERRGMPHFIGGRFVPAASGDSFETENPATGRPYARVARGDAEDVDRAVQAARRAFEDGPWPRMARRDRASLLHRLADAIERRADAIADLESLDTGLPIRQARGGQIPRAAENFRFFAERLLHLEERAYPVDDAYLNYTLRRPVGVAGLITPWNTPFMLETWKVAPCLAAGDTCVLKPAEWSPATAVLLAEAVAEADLPPGVVNVVQGIGEEAGAALVDHPAVALISFTGETATGREIVRRGSATLKRFSLELGGKSPVLVFADSDMERAVAAAAYGVFSLNGERCTAGSRVLAERAVYGEVCRALAERADTVRVGAPHDPDTEVGPLITAAHLKRVLGYVRGATAEGARLLAGGAAAGAPTAGGHYLRPTVFADVPPQSRLAQEEVFGPVVAVMPFDAEEQAVALANGVRYGLAAYLWTSDVSRAHRVASRLEAGMVWVNSPNVRHLPAPFGGAKQSGLGREGGDFSFDFYMETVNVCVPLRQAPVPPMGRPGAGPAVQGGANARG
jgi:5-carboxymethyl-2-hydroxymuconic-semialdehyde dehydrogenase